MSHERGKFLFKNHYPTSMVTIILYGVNPLTYLWLLGSYFSKDITVTGTSTFTPSALGLSPAQIAQMFHLLCMELLVPAVP